LCNPSPSQFSQKFLSPDVATTSTYFSVADVVQQALATPHSLFSLMMLVNQRSSLESRDLSKSRDMLVTGIAVFVRAI
ncbi:MAG: hypothetical protein AAF141_14570, partial [Pseudomonadota bacterium]